jgi:hypothetical protein
MAGRSLTLAGVWDFLFNNCINCGCVLWPAKKRKALLCRSNKKLLGREFNGASMSVMILFYTARRAALLAKWIFPRLIFKDNWAARNEIKASVFAAAGALERDWVTLQN